jgi:energy-converting hydrogenase A subunit R
VGGEEKALALKKISALHNLPLSQAFYAGDRITDVQVFQEVNRAGGLTLAINGNAYAVREARLACLSGTTLPLAVLAEVFNREGTEGALNLAEKLKNPPKQLGLERRDPSQSLPWAEKRDPSLHSG